MKLNDWRDSIGAAMKTKGFWDDGTGFADGGMFRASLATTEVCESMQEVKPHWGKDENDGWLRDKVAEENADAAIRLFDLAAFCRIHLDDDFMLSEWVLRGPNKRVQLINLLGKVNAKIGTVYDVFEDCLDGGLYDNFDNLDQTPEERFHSEDDEWGFHEEVSFALVEAISLLDFTCRQIGRDLYQAIDKKMAANMVRPQKYGTPDEGK
jgi:hypothetical protein